MQLLAMKHTWTYSIFLNNSNSYENYNFSAYTVFQLLNLYLKTDEIVYHPFIRSIKIVSGRVLNENFINSLVSMAKNYIFLGDDRGSGYQFYKYVSIGVFFLNRKSQYIIHFFGGKVNKYKRLKNNIYDSTDTSDSSDSDKKIKNKFPELIGELLKIR